MSDAKLFLDTNVLIENPDYFSDVEFVISDKTLFELEEIKSSRSKADDVRSAARKAIRFLNDHKDRYEVIVYNNSIRELINSYNIPETPDNIICACASWYSTNVIPIKFITFDVGCEVIASKIFGLNVERIKIKESENYTGFKEVIMSNEEMAYFYEHQDENIYNLLTNQYIIIKNIDNEIVDSYRWDGVSYQQNKIGNIKSDFYGAVKPYKGDIYQQCLLNSFINNRITMVRGKAGTGKTWCTIGYCMYLLEKKKIDKIIFFTNTQPTLNTATIGFLPGTRDQKLAESSVGNILASKLGDSFILEKLMSEGKILLLPMCDIRGFDTTNMNAAVVITEAQNLDIYLMKLALQRIGNDSICIIDGDYNAQVDKEIYAGKNNGMRRLSEVFRGQDFYGEVELQNIYRSKIAELAEQL